MAIDNFNLIKPLLKFDNKEEFYFFTNNTKKKGFCRGTRKTRKKQ